MGKQIKEIRQAWLMWIGDKHYPSFKDFAVEAEAQGVSKRVPNAAVAREVVADGSVVFLAHDEGEQDACLECLDTFDCPDCSRVDAAPQGQILRGRLSKRRAVDCPRCDGTGRVTEGTGGTVYVDRKCVPYRTFVGRLRHGMRRDDHKVRMEMPCEICSATGSTPRAMISGMFVPHGSEYILRPGDEAEVLRKLRKAGVRIVGPGALAREQDRGCGRRTPGGVYIVTEPAGDGRRKGEVKALIARGLLKPEVVEVHGAFASFVEPIPVAQKRFRGIKKIAMPTGADVQAEHILEAMA